LNQTAQKLLDVIANQIAHGALRSKEPGIATMPEIHEACGLDVDAMYAQLRLLQQKGLIELTGEYPFEEIRLLQAPPPGRAFAPPEKP